MTFGTRTERGTSNGTCDYCGSPINIDCVDGPPECCEVCARREEEAFNQRRVADLTVAELRNIIKRTIHPT